MTDLEIIPLYDKPRDLRPAKDWWAPGTYLVTCHTCERVYQGAQFSRACAPCTLGTVKVEKTTKAGEYRY